MNENMKYECFGVNGFAGDRTPEAMDECHPFAEALSEFLEAPVKLYGSSKQPKNLQWNNALDESADVFSMVARVIKGSLAKKNIPILVTPRCASAISSLPVVEHDFIRSRNIMTFSKQQIESNLNELAELIRGRAVYISY